MSYSEQVKTEIVQHWGPQTDEFMACLAAVMKQAGTMSLLPGREFGFRISTENAKTAGFLTKYIKEYIHPKIQLVVSKGNSLRKKNLYHINLDGIPDLKDWLEKLGILGYQGEDLVIRDDVPQDLLKDDATKRAYIKGAFLGSGSISHPEKQYHLEFVLQSEAYGKGLADLLAGYGIKGRMIPRKGSQILYIKGSEQVVDLLNVLSAHQSLLETENIRIVKGLRNSVNRIVNCETANLDKTVTASVRQVEAIRHIQRTVGLDRLPEPLRQLAEARLNYPDASLKELGDILEPPVGKSGINHRFRKIEAIAEEIDRGDV